MKLKSLLLKLWLLIKPEPPVTKPVYDPVNVQLKQLWQRLFPDKEKVIGRKVKAEPILTKEDILKFLPWAKKYPSKGKGVPSQPFIIIIENTGDKPLKDVEILDAVNRFQLDSYENEFLKITYGVPGFDYKAFLSHLLSFKYGINQIRLMGFGENAASELSSLILRIEQWELIGNMFGNVITPSLDSYQFTQLVVDEFVSFDLDCLTRLRFDEIPPHIKIRVYLYPTIKY
jgi:hypothetical protein